MQQQILAQYPAADLAVAVIWMPMLPTDARDEWDDQLLADPRVTHLWDADRIVGRWLADNPNLDLRDTGEIVWDAFLLFGPEAIWERAPSGLLAWGGPLVGRFSELADTLAPLLEAPPAKAVTPAAERSARSDEQSPWVFAGREEVSHADDTSHVVG